MSSPSRRNFPTIASMLFALIAALVPSVALSGNVALSGPAAAQSVTTPHVEAELIARHTSFQPGKPIELAQSSQIHSTGRFIEASQPQGVSPHHFIHHSKVTRI